MRLVILEILNHLKEKSGKGYFKPIHRIVAEAFLEDFDQGLHVNHKNMIKTDNSVENLEMVTPGQNKTHAQINVKKKRGVSYMKKEKVYRATIYFKTKEIYRFL